jgi:hypothetical protein
MWGVELMELERWKEERGCSAKAVVVVQVEWDGVGTNPALVVDEEVFVVGDEGSLERDVSAANRWARVQDRDSTRFPR